MTKKRNLLIVILSIIMTTCLSVGFTICPMFNHAYAEAAKSTEAYYLGEDWDTLGMWYTGETGKAKDNCTPSCEPDCKVHTPTSHRVYGQDGVILLNHGQVADGDSLMGKANEENSYLDNHTTFKGGRDAHYVEYPSYLEVYTTHLKVPYDFF